MPKGNKKSGRRKHNDDSDDDSGDAASKDSSTDVNMTDLDFAQRRELQRKAASDKRRSKMRCFVCGKQGHVRRECPGIADDGRGESKYTKSKGDSGATNLKTSGKRGAKNRGRKVQNDEPGNDIELPEGFGPVERGEAGIDHDNDTPESVEPFLYFDAGCDSMATIKYLRFGRGKNKLSLKEATEEYQRAMDSAASSSNYGGRISRCSLKPGKPWLISSNNSPLTGDTVWFALELGREFSCNNDDEKEAAKTQLLEAATEHGDRVVGFFCHLDYSESELNRAGGDKKTQLRRLLCTCEAAAKAQLTVQIRTSPSAAVSRTSPEDETASAHEVVIFDVGTFLAEILQIHPNLKVHLSCWCGTADAMVALLQKLLENIWIGMDGSVTFAKVTRAHECAFDVPLSKLLLETGTPDTIPSRISRSKGREAFCHSGLIPFVAEAIASHKGSDTVDVCASEVARAASINTLELYPQLKTAQERALSSGNDH